MIFRSLEQNYLSQQTPSRKMIKQDKVRGYEFFIS